DGLHDLAAGAWERAADKFGYVLDVQASGDQEVPTWARACLAQAMLAGGKVEAAVAATERAFTVLMRSGLWLCGTDLVQVRVGALVRDGRLGAAEEAVEAFAGGLVGCRAPAPLAALATCRAVVAEAGGEVETAVAAFGDAAEEWEGLPRPYDAALALERR